MGTGSPKIYTRTGDKGKTSLIGGARVSKSNLRLDAYGTIDELNSWLGMLACEITSDFAAQTQNRQPQLQDEGHSVGSLYSLLMTIQRDLFNIGSRLACEDPELKKQLPTLNENSIGDLERQMDIFSAALPPLKNFVLPGGARSAAAAHIARTVCRRAERLCVALDSDERPNPNDDDSIPTSDEAVIRYMNRLSDFLFILARHLNRLLGHAEPIWTAQK